MKGFIYAGLIILLMALILPVFAFSNSPPGLQKATSLVVEEQPMLIADQIFDVQHFTIRAHKSELNQIVVIDIITKDEQKELPNTIYNRKENRIWYADRLFLCRKARDAL